MAAGHSARAVAEIRRAREIDPTSLVINRDVGHILGYSRRYGEPIEQFRRTLAMDPSFHQTRLYLISALTDVGRFRGGGRRGARAASATMARIDSSRPRSSPGGPTRRTCAR
jgi:hypothetical protein